MRLSRNMLLDPQSLCAYVHLQWMTQLNSQWRYVKSAADSADDASLGLSSLQSSSRWVTRPALLSQLDGEWLHQTKSLDLSSSGEAEVRCALASTTDGIPEGWGNPTDYLIYYLSSWRKLLRAGSSSQVLCVSWIHLSMIWAHQDWSQTTKTWCPMWCKASHSSCPKGLCDSLDHLSWACATWSQ